MKFPATLVLFVTLTFADDQHDTASLMSFLQNTAAFQALPLDLRTVTVKLATAAENGRLLNHIDKIGFPKVKELLRYLPVDDAHDLEDYLLKSLTEEYIKLQTSGSASTESQTSAEPVLTKRRSKRSTSSSYLQQLESSSAYQSLPDQYKVILRSLVSAARSNKLSQYIRHDVSLLPRLLQHMNPSLARRLNAYFMQQLRVEARQNHHHEGDDDD